jgi:hypothetical protein
MGNGYRGRVASYIGQSVRVLSRSFRQAVPWARLTIPPLNRSRRLEKSKLAHEIPNAHIESLSYSQQRMQADPLLPTLDFPNVHRMEFGFFREFFLAQPSLFTELPDCIAQDFKVFLGARHRDLAKQDDKDMNTPNMGLFDSWFSKRLTTERNVSGVGGFRSSDGSALYRPQCC